MKTEIETVEGKSIPNLLNSPATKSRPFRHTGQWRIQATQMKVLLTMITFRDQMLLVGFRTEGTQIQS